MGLPVTAVCFGDPMPTIVPDPWREAFICGLERLVVSFPSK